MKSPSRYSIAFVIDIRFLAYRVTIYKIHKDNLELKLGRIRLCCKNRIECLTVDEFQVGDMISVIDMPPPGESTWWRGKHGFAVGFFPAECVAVIGDKVPRHLTVSTTVRSKLPVKPVLRKHGKLIAFFRSFILNRPSRRRLKQSGILKERVFGCDLGEHLLNSGQDGTCIGSFRIRHLTLYGPIVISNWKCSAHST